MARREVEDGWGFGTLKEGCDALRNRLPHWRLVNRVTEHPRRPPVIGHIESQDFHSEPHERRTDDAGAGARDV